jgi:uncharacterized membrane protein (DUF4010 family)
MNAIPALAFSLAIALGLGLLIGLQRGFEYRDLPEGGRIAGWRTFGLIGLGGGVAAFLGQSFGPFVPAAGVAALALLLAAGYWRMAAETKDVSLTTALAALLTYGLGALAVMGERETAVGAAVVVTFLLSLKEQLHGFLRELEPREVEAAVKLLVLSLVVLPLLPNRAFGPYDAFNPYSLWFLVVLLAGLSFIGYAAVKIVGPSRGLLVTGLFGGLASSTAVTLAFARLARKDEALAKPLSAGIAAASAVMALRLLVVVFALDRGLALALAPVLGAGAAVGGAAALLLRRLGRRDGETSKQAIADLLNPFELKPALFFAALLTVIAFLARFLQSEVGDAGLYALAAIAGLADVDALSVTAAGLVSENRATLVAATHAILIAVAVNTLAKSAIAAFIGGRALAKTAVPVHLAMLAVFAVLGWAI